VSFYRHVFGRLSPAGEQGRLSILIFHRVLPSPDPLFPDLPDAAEFNGMLGWLNSWFNLLPLQQAIERLRERSLPERAAAITFDDGYADNHDVALPLLVKNGVPATFFITTGFLNGGLMWNDAIIEAIRRCRAPNLVLREVGFDAHAIGSTADLRQTIDQLLARVKYLPVEERLRISRAIAAIAGVTLPDDLMMSGVEVRALRQAGMEIGAHTVTHPILAQLDEDDARQEIGASKRALEDLLQEPVRLFAYPNGKPGRDYLPAHARMVRELSFDAAVSTSAGVADGGSDVMQLPRFTPWDKGRLRFGLRLASNLRTISHA
jgi:peptidoglycan/xylan/chitin deacetylase (PgdA/CDA1 family)